MLNTEIPVSEIDYKGQKFTLVAGDVNLDLMKSYQYADNLIKGGSTPTDAEFEAALPLATQLINTITDGGDI